MIYRKALVLAAGLTNLTPAATAPATATLAPVPVLDARQVDSPNCTTAHVFLARGPTENYPGVQAAVVEAVCQGISSCAYTDVGYAASVDEFCDSVVGGVMNGTILLNQYSARCPESKIVLSGYLQGATVMDDILGGIAGTGSYCNGTTSEALDPNGTLGQQIVAVLLFGDLRHTANQTYNVGSASDKNGLMPRSGQELKAFNKWADRVRSYCNEDDLACAGGSDEGAEEQDFDEDVSDAALWARSKLGIETSS